MENGDTHLRGRDVLQIVGFFAIVLGVVLGAAWLAAWYHTDREGMFAVVGGAALLGAAAIKPKLFWENIKALALRGLIGDRATTVIYMLVGLGLIMFGGTRLSSWEHSFTECRRLYAEAQTTQERMYVLQRPPGPPVESFLWTYDPLTCHRYRERRPF